ncbi:TetR family transcriptional regulator [Nocardia sp. NPDC050793]|uniref:TetR/AcrR family transcriptional regulator n=1 Tax=Nocardia sp. NPDC050793 TaxID=3155159 RepID=UPI0033CD2194
MRKGEKLLTRADWARAALDAIGKGGIAAVRVDRLAPELGATRGSFYWHFEDRRDLLTAALDMWERDGITDVETALAALDDPTARLRAIFATAFSHPETANIEAALTTHADDALVAPVLKRITAARLTLLRKIFGELGFDPSESEQRARIFHVSYLGHFQARRATPTAYRDTDYLDTLLHLLTRSA